MLSSDDVDTLIDVVWKSFDHYPPLSRIRALTDEDFAKLVPGNVPAHELASSCVTWVLQNGSAQAFINLVEMCDAAEKEPRLHGLVAALRANPQEWIQRTPRVLWVPNEFPFVNRDHLRQIMRDMADPMFNMPTPSVLVIEGQAGAGKSTMAQYVRQLGEVEKRFVPVVRELRVETNSRFDIPQLGGDLRRSMGGDRSCGVQDVQREREALNQASSVDQASLMAGSPVWLVLNVVSLQGLHESVITFIDDLIRRIQQPAASGKLRVVIVTEDVSLLRLSNLPTGSRFTLPAIEPRFIEDWLHEAVPGRDPNLYTASAQHIVEKAEAFPDHERLGMLARFTKDVHENLEKRPVSP